MSNEIQDSILQKLKRHVFEIESRTDISKEEKISQIINIFAVICAGIAVQPIPFADIVILTPIQVYMGTRIAAIHGIPVSESKVQVIIKEFAGTVGLGFLAQQLAIGAYKTFIPFLGAVTTIPMVYGLTYAIGKVMDVYFAAKAQGKELSKEEIKQTWRREKKAGEEKGKAATEEVKQEAQKETKIKNITGEQHLQELDMAISTATKSLCILSGWVRNAVVTPVRVSNLEKSVQRGVKIYIGYGYQFRGQPNNSDPYAETLLFELQKSCPNQVFIAKFSCHEKILVKDCEYFIIGSNNWLANSFRGDNSEQSVKIYDSENAKQQLQSTKDKVLAHHAF